MHTLILEQITLHNLYEHQDNNNREKELILAERLNIRVYDFLENTTKIQTNTHILNSPIPIYIINKYYYSTYIRAIHKHCGKMKAKQYTKNKYQWSSMTINNTEWKADSKYIKNKRIQKGKQ